MIYSKTSIEVASTQLYKVNFLISFIYTFTLSPFFGRLTNPLLFLVYSLVTKSNKYLDIFGLLYGTKWLALKTFIKVMSLSCKTHPAFLSSTIQSLLLSTSSNPVAPFQVKFDKYFNTPFVLHIMSRSPLYKTIGICETIPGKSSLAGGELAAVKEFCTIVLHSEKLTAFSTFKSCWISVLLRYGVVISDTGG